MQGDKPGNFGPIWPLWVLKVGLNSGKNKISKKGQHFTNKVKIFVKKQDLNQKFYYKIIPLLI